MADEQLRLVASLKDNASPGVRRIKSELKTVDVSPGMQQAQKWVRSFNEDVARFKRSSMTVASVMSAMGVGGLAAAGSIGTLAAAFKGLADRTLDMRELGREVGLTADEINAMNRAGQHFGFDPSQMEGAIKHFAGLMPEFKRGYGELNNILARQPDLIKRLRVEDTKTQIKEIFDFLGTIKNPQDRMVFERGIFGTDGIEKLFAEGGNGFEAQAEKFRRTLAPITEQAAVQAQALRDAINDFNAAVDNLELKAGPTVYRWLTAGVTKLEQVLEKVERHPGDAAAIAGVGTGAAATLLLRRRIMAGSMLAGGGGAEMRAAAGQLSGAGAGLDKTAVTLNEAAVALREAAIELRGRGATPPGGPGAGPEPGKGGAPEIVKDAPKGFLGEGGLKGVGGSIMEGLFGAMVYQAGEQAMDAVLGWTPKDQKTLDRATSLSNVYKDVREQLFGGGLHDSRVKDDACPASEPRMSTLSPESYWARKRAFLDPPAVAGFHAPAAYDREMRARMAPRDDAPDRSLDSFVVGAVDKPIMHLVGTLKTAAAQAEADGIKPAAFNPGGLIGAATSDPVTMLAAGVKQGMLEAMREWAGGTGSADASTARGGIIPASFGGGGGGGGGNPALGGGFGGGAPDLSGGDAQGAEADRIRELAKKYGIDPRVAVAVAKSEGLGHAWGSGVDAGTSFGAFQLHVGGGLGDIYQRETGKDPRNAANAYDMDDWALRYASQHGWGDWHGAAHIGVHGMAGIGGRPVGGANLSGADGIGGGAGGGFTGKGDAVGIASSMLGFGERQSAQALGHIMHAGEWCADFVNGVIEKSGGKGSGSAMASSFARWGKAVTMADAKRGDVILENAHGRGINHVGLVESVDHDKLGRAIGIHMISGNYGHIVRRNLEPFREIQGLRRGNEASNAALQGAAAELRDAAARQRDAATDQRGAARAVARVPDWHDPDRPDLGAEKRKVEDRRQQAAAMEGGIDAHVHLHDHRTNTRVERRGVVRDASITVRRAPQRTFTI